MVDGAADGSTDDGCDGYDGKDDGENNKLLRPPPRQPYPRRLRRIRCQLLLRRECRFSVTMGRGERCAGFWRSAAGLARVV